MKRILPILLLIPTLALTGCTQNQRAKQFGGNAELKLPPNQKLICVTWEESHLWYLTRQMRTNEVPESYTMKEQSSWGVFQGTYNIYETK